MYRYIYNKQLISIVLLNLCQCLPRAFLFVANGNYFHLLHS